MSGVSKWKSTQPRSETWWATHYMLFIALLSVILALHLLKFPLPLPLCYCPHLSSCNENKNWWRALACSHHIAWLLILPFSHPSTYLPRKLLGQGRKSKDLVRAVGPHFWPLKPLQNGLHGSKPKSTLLQNLLINQRVCLEGFQCQCCQGG